jgi:hypothetical protein
MTELRFTNLNILSKLEFYYLAIVDKFNYFIKCRLL